MVRRNPEAHPVLTGASPLPHHVGTQRVRWMIGTRWAHNRQGLTRVANQKSEGRRPRANIRVNSWDGVIMWVRACIPAASSFTPTCEQRGAHGPSPQEAWVSRGMRPYGGHSLLTCLGDATQYSDLQRRWCVRWGWVFSNQGK